MGIPAADFSGPETDSGKGKEVLTVVGLKGDFVKKPKRYSLPRGPWPRRERLSYNIFILSEANQLDVIAARPHPSVTNMYTP
jgi:hypothetical protein